MGSTINSRSTNSTCIAEPTSHTTSDNVITSQQRQRQRQTVNASVTASNTLVVKRSGWSPDPSHILEAALKNDRITSLHFIGLQFEETAILRLIQLLESPRNLPNNLSGWNYVFFSNCHFPHPSIGGGSPVVGANDSRRWRSNYLPPSKTMANPCLQLARVLAQSHIQKLLIQDCMYLTAALLEQGNAMPNVRGLTIQHRHGLNNSQCQALGKLVSSSKGLKELSLRGTPIPSGTLLAPGLAISYHLETLILGESYLSKQSLNDIVLAIPDQKSINYGLKTVSSLSTSIQATYRLLTSPQSNLSALDLSHLHLNDNHMEILAPLLTDPKSKLEQLNLSFNQIGDQGLKIFCQHLPKMHKLSKVSLNPNPWKDGKVLCDAMKDNTSVEYLDSLLFLPEAKLLRYYTTINRGGRRLIQHQRRNGVVPLGLWAKVLERAGKIQYFVHDQEQAKANSVYHLLSNGPIFFHQP